MNLTWSAGLAVWLGAVSSSVAGAAPRHRALWVWDHGAAARSAVDRRDLFAFAAEHSVDTLYYESSRLIRNDPSDLGAFLRAAARKHLSVEMLFSSNTWIYPGGQDRAVEVVKAAVKLAASVRYGRPTALHFDIEPYLLQEWKHGQVDRIEADYLQLLKKLEAVRGPFPIHVDIPFWFYRVRGAPGTDGPSQPLDRQVLAIVDGCTLMDYRDVAEGADGLIADGQHVIGDADGLGKSVVIGVETNPVRPSQVTFFEEGAQTMTSQLSAVDSAFQGDPSFAGTAVEDYRGFRSLRP
jgi:hypothetical protein